MNFNAAYWIEKLGLQVHPEGGAFAETYRSVQVFDCNGLQLGIEGNRTLSTSIYFLVKQGKGFSAFHRLKSDEVWHFYTGSPLLILEFDEAGILQQQWLGNNPEKGQVFQYVVKGGRWFAAKVEEPEGFALCGCTVSPGFDFRDFELAERAFLFARYPSYIHLIQQLTHE